MKKNAKARQASSPESGVPRGELRRNAEELALLEGRWKILGDAKQPTTRRTSYQYVDELVRLQFELLKMQEWVRLQGLKVCVLFEGRDAAGKGGVIKRITACLNPRVCRVVALGTPTERERSQWYFQRYVAHLPAAGEIVLFDRSWYNRAGVERVMGFCSDKQYQEFLRSCPLFEEMLVRSDIVLVKYWFSVNDEEQERRFAERMRNPIKRWKLSPMDLEARKYWVEYSKAKDVMLEHTDRKKAPWFIIDADNKKRARLNCIAHLLTQVPYKDLHPIEIELPLRQQDTGYKRPKKSSQRWVTRIY
ncbi:MAG: polyphosphate kinase 2 [Steroidobacteraceae bacterium]|jgi:polyphosphate kinase